MHSPKVLPKQKQPETIQEAAAMLQEALSPFHHKLLYMIIERHTMDIAYASGLVLQEEFGFDEKQTAEFLRLAIARATTIRQERDTANAPA